MRTEGFSCGRRSGGSSTKWTARLTATALFLVLAACAGEEPPPPAPPPPPPAPAPAPAPVRTTPDAPFRAQPPAGEPDVAFVPPAIQTLSLKNGVKVLFVERHDLPIVSVRAVVTAGAGDLPKEPPGLLSFMGSMLEQGAGKRSALEISDAFEAMGAQHFAWVEWDSGGAAVKVTTDKLAAALPLVADITLRPTFPQAEIDRLKARRVAGLQQEKNNVTAMGMNAIGPVLYGRAHPYGNSLAGRPDDVSKLTRDALVRAHAALFAPSRTAILVAGDVTKAALSKLLEASFGAWTGTPAAITVPKAPPPTHDDARVAWVDKPGAPQSVVRLVEVGVPRNAPDRDAIAVMNTILGGMFSSRINLNLREAHAFTYGAGSGFQMRHGPGQFSAGGNMVADKTAPAIAELFKEVKSIRDRPVTEDELETAKKNIVRAMPGRFETVGELTGALSDLVVYGLPLDEYATRAARIEKITADDVLKAAKDHLHPDRIKVIVVGDRAKLEPTLEPLHLGPIEERDAYGDPLLLGKGAP